ncbi:MAG TPA: hypothetical protein VNQ76_12890 [Planctomicrobium sp.]|nr:hypothetical protein [Planctomicrobium sp.]
MSGSFMTPKLLTVAVFSLVYSLSVLPVHGMGGEAIPLPSDPSVAVVELWYVDRGELREPEVAVFANGRVRVNVGDGSLWGELEPEQVQSLVSSLIQRDDFKSLRTEKIQADVEAESAKTGLSCVISNAGDTIIRVRTATDLYRIDGHAVGLLATRFPRCQSLQKLYSAQCRLENVRAVIMVGGPEAAERIAKLAQLQVQSHYGGSIEVNPGHLSMVRLLADGTRFCQFLVRTATDEPSSPRVITVFESPGEVPRISILPEGPTLR